MADWNFKDLARRTASDKVLREKAFSIAKNLKYDGYQESLAFMVYKFLIKNPLHVHINLLKVVVLKTKLSKMNN